MLLREGLFIPANAVEAALDLANLTDAVICCGGWSATITLPLSVKACERETGVSGVWMLTAVGDETTLEDCWVVRGVHDGEATQLLVGDDGSCGNSSAEKRGNELDHGDHDGDLV